MEFIKKQSIKFNCLVKDYLTRKYKLKNVKYIKDLNKKNCVWIKNNIIIVSNSILNLHYNTQLDEKKYSLVSILYRNIYYKKVYQQNKIKNVCYLDLLTKRKLGNLWSKLSKTINLDENAVLISRKYYNKKNKDEKNFSCFGLLCVYPLRTNKTETSTITKTETSTMNKSDVDAVEIQEYINKKDLVATLSDSIAFCDKGTRRKFLYNLKSLIGSEDTIDTIDTIDTSTMYMKGIIKNSLFIDVEYVNDIYDDFQEFPISKDNSLLCMIGISHLHNNVLKYDDLTVKRLDSINEYDILYKFLNIINKTKNKICQDRQGSKILMFHWSNADKNILEKALVKYPDLWSIYNTKYKNDIIYIDLLKVVKNTIKLKSYSLKYVSNILLNYTYESDCKNGLDAMCSIILNEQTLNSTNKNHENLLNFENTHDVIRYNKIDTQLLYIILKYFVNF